MMMMMMIKKRRRKKKNIINNNNNEDDKKEEENKNTLTFRNRLAYTTWRHPFFQANSKALDLLAMMLTFDSNKRMMLSITTILQVLENQKQRS